MDLDPTEPLYIIELGTGSGKFSFFMLKALLEMKVRSRWDAILLVVDTTDMSVQHECRRSKSDCLQDPLWGENCWCRCRCILKFGI